MNIPHTVATALLAASIAVPGIGAQERTAAEDAYFRAVAEFFAMPASEVSILSDWRLAAQEIPVVLFVAHQAGVSPEALVALRRSGKGWGELVARYHLTASQFYVPLPNGASAGVLQGVYDRYRAVPTPSWSEVTLDDGDIVSLVNLRVLSQTLHIGPSQVLEGAPGGDWVAAYSRLVREQDSVYLEGSTR